MAPIPDSETLTRMYLRMRQAKADLTRAYELEKADIEKDMKTVEALLQSTLLQHKARSMATKSGTFFLETTVKPSCVDWSAYYEWLIESGDLAGLEKRVARNFIVEYQKAHDGALPPGITTYEEVVCRVRVGNEN